MIIQVLGCSGAIAAGSRTTSFLIDDDVLIDAGTGVGDLTLEALARIEHIVLSHSHLDHIVSIPLLADSVMHARRGKAPVQVHALPETIDALRQHIFNGVIWPDFTQIPSADQPVLRLMPFAVGDILELRGKRVEVLSAVHTVPAVGFALEGGRRGNWVFTGDTGPNPALWARLRHMKVAQLVIETAFGNDEHALAAISRHLCPRMLGDELRNLEGQADVFITHIKPGERDAVMAEIGRLDLPNRIRSLTAGQTMEVG